MVVVVVMLKVRGIYQSSDNNVSYKVHVCVSVCLCACVPVCLCVDEGSGEGKARGRVWREGVMVNRKEVVVWVVGVRS